MILCMVECSCMCRCGKPCGPSSSGKAFEDCTGGQPRWLWEQGRHMRSTLPRMKGQRMYMVETGRGTSFQQQLPQVCCLIIGRACWNHGCCLYMYISVCFPFCNSPGATATIVNDACMTPWDVIKQRMQISHSPFKNILDCATTTWRAEGLRAFYRSYWTTVRMIRIVGQPSENMKGEIYIIAEINRFSFFAAADECTVHSHPVHALRVHEKVLGWTRHR